MNPPDDLSPFLAQAGKAVPYASLDGEDLFQGVHLQSCALTWRVSRKNLRGKISFRRSLVIGQEWHQIFLRLKNETEASLVLLATQRKRRGRVQAWRIRGFRKNRLINTFELPPQEERDMVRTVLRKIL